MWKEPEADDISMRSLIIYLFNGELAENSRMQQSFR